MRSLRAARRFFHPSDAIEAPMTIAATWSSHQKPIPMPTTPTMPAAAVCQSALFMSASA